VEVEYEDLGEVNLYDSRFLIEGRVEDAWLSVYRRGGKGSD